ncbi:MULTISPECIES: 3-deoxy-manno-octulosonate cytidylyltransferase [Prochlorococcus]|uniref:3-deoxy-manno-octulosonate cytidylyltransferase n=1 Tax=Prochlorococcus TaxID=1218 RepID=UPI000533A501|nr:MULTISPECIES: 3-deoxy-manno-octulosonate cytidylyltransferase [Prochlorococcus]KGG12032.1 3-deoxy-manno-octulosonate cytidylyltransferase [Prochlorococcus sp. MIT 0601]
MKACVIIPARYNSTRFPGKPLVQLNGKPLIIWVAELSARAIGKEDVYIATDDNRIAKLVNESGYNSIFTSSNLLTGTDRVAEAAKDLDYDIFVNVQGDEPLVNETDILRAINFKKSHYESVINCYNNIRQDEQPENINIPKVVVSEDNTLLYMSRSLIPANKKQILKSDQYKKQVCIYAYSPVDLDRFLSFGRKSYLESKEDIEILRFFELGIKIKMFHTKYSSLAVDVPSDIPLVEQQLSQIFK